MSAIFGGFAGVNLATIADVGTLLARITAVLLAAWAVHGVLRDANPRWRILLWRGSAIGVLTVALVSMRAPLMTLRVLPPTPRPTYATDSAAGVEFAGRTPEGVNRGQAFEPTASRALANPRGFVVETPITLPATAFVDEGPAPAPRHLDGGASHWPLSTRVLAIWLFGAGLAVCRMVIGGLRVGRWLRGTMPVPAWIGAEAELIAARIAPGGEIVVRQTTAVNAPCSVGLVRDVILLPATMCGEDRAKPSEVRAALAHELAHFAGHDLRWSHALNLFSALLWFHPLAWRWRAAHAEACDERCDAAAAEALGDRSDYARALAAIALRLSGRMPLAALSMARRPTVLRRIAALQRRAGAARLPRRRLAVACSSAIVLVALVGAAGIGQSVTIDEQPNGADTAAQPSDSTGATGEARATGEAPAAERGNGPPVPLPPKRAAGHSDDRALQFQAVHVRTIAADTGAPLAAVRLKVRYWRSRQHFEAWYETDDRGEADLELPTNRELSWVAIESHPEGRVPAYYSWDGGSRDIAPPRQLTIRFDPGIEVGGIVQDDGGQPIEGAEVELTLNATLAENDSLVFTLGKTRTKADGRWSMAGAPSDLRDLGVQVTHPDHLRPERLLIAPETWRRKEAVFRMSRGLILRGRIIDIAGQPVSGARVMLGSDRWGSDDAETKTSSDGTYVVKHCKPGPSVVTVQAEGFAPDLRPVQVTADAAPIDFQLQAATIFRARVVDTAGNPLAGANVAADTWRGHRSIDWRVNTDKEGRVEWTSAPRDAVQYSIVRPGHLRTDNPSLVATAEEHDVVMQPITTVKGSVTDAKTGAAVANFRVIEGVYWPGRQEIWWNRGDAMNFTDGAYEVRLDTPRPASRLRIEADGYQPTESQRFRIIDGDRTFDFALEEGTGPTGVVVDPAGAPVVRADVVALGRRGQISFRNGRLDNQARNNQSQTDREGRFRLLPMDAPFLLVALHDAGYAEILTDRIAGEFKIELRPWASVGGRMFAGRKPLAASPVDVLRYDAGGGTGYGFGEVQLDDPRQALASAWKESPAGPGPRSDDGPLPDSRQLAKLILTGLQIHAWDNGTVPTDAEGNFRIPRIIPGKVGVARVLVVKQFSGWSNSYSHQAILDLAPGESAKVQIGGTGRPVVGQIAPIEVNGAPYDWAQNETIMLRVATSRRQADPDREFSTYRGYVAADGSFRIDDVPAGQYELSLGVTPPADGARCGYGDEIGRVTAEVNVPMKPADEPLDLGTLTPAMIPILNVGDAAPSFELTTMGDDASLKMADLRGKVVLIDFWATWCGPCVAELPHLAEIYQEFGNRDDFVMLSVSVDQNREAVDEFVAQRQLPWSQAWLERGLQHTLCAEFALRSVPATFLIDREGRIAAKGLQDVSLKEAIAALLRS